MNSNSEQFKTGDRVAVYSLQSFYGPGFYRGHHATVKQDQIPGGSVLVLLDPYRLGSGEKADVSKSYEVYPEQLRRLKRKKRSS